MWRQAPRGPGDPTVAWLLVALQTGKSVAADVMAAVAWPLLPDSPAPPLPADLLAAAVAAADRLSHNYAGPEHLLLALAHTAPACLPAGVTEAQLWAVTCKRLGIHPAPAEPV
jgi:hypothetical protein